MLRMPCASMVRVRNNRQRGRQERQERRQQREVGCRDRERDGVRIRYNK